MMYNLAIKYLSWKIRKKNFDFMDLIISSDGHTYRNTNDKYELYSLKNENEKIKKEKIELEKQLKVWKMRANSPS